MAPVGLGEFSRGCGWRRWFAEVEVREEDEVGEEGADGIDKGIPRSGGAAGDEGLVDFVEACVAGGDDEGGDAPRPMPTDACAADSAEEKNAEDEIFGEVSGFTDDVMNVGDLVAAQVREYPAQERLDDAAGVVLRKGVGGHDEDEASPEECGPPGAEPPWNQRGGQARLDFGEVGGGAWVAPGLVGHC